MSATFASTDKIIKSAKSGTVFDILSNVDVPIAIILILSFLLNLNCKIVD